VGDKAVDEPKSIRQIRIRFSDLTTEEKDPYIRYCIKSIAIEDLGMESMRRERTSECLWIPERTSIPCPDVSSWHYLIGIWISST